MSTSELTTKRLNKGEVAKHFGHSHMWTTRAVKAGVIPPPIGGKSGYWTVEYLMQWESRLAEQNIELALAKMKQGN